MNESTRIEVDFEVDGLDLVPGRDDSPALLPVAVPLDVEHAVPAAPRRPHRVSQADVHLHAVRQAIHDHLRLGEVRSEWRRCGRQRHCKRSFVSDSIGKSIVTTESVFFVS